ncbi:MotE family protein [Aestuariivirga sp.]|jgi:flagellar motility protein MotE (MotC chaperone)|uniref:MotE family protein n=1 Tax=Aestuariivirga sp. TaxID=2650926 RepID=UPI00378419FD
MIYVKKCSTTMLIGLIMTSHSSAVFSSEEPVATQSPSTETIIQDYCAVVIDQASEQRQAQLAQSLTALEERIGIKLKELESAQISLEALVKKRDDLRLLAKKEIVDIYAGMEPAIAATQLEETDVYLASSIIRQLKPRQASAILDEIKPAFAAKVVRLLAAVPSISDSSE